MFNNNQILKNNSKILNKGEFRALTGIINDKSCLKDASSKLSQFKQDSIELHWKHNRHHPEHFKNINDTDELIHSLNNEMSDNYLMRMSDLISSDNTASNKFHGIFRG